MSHQAISPQRTCAEQDANARCTEVNTKPSYATAGMNKTNYFFLETAAAEHNPMGTLEMCWLC